MNPEQWGAVGPNTIWQATPDRPHHQPLIGGYPAGSPIKGESHLDQWPGVEVTQPVTPVTTWMKDADPEPVVRKPRWVRKPERAYRELVIDAVWTLWAGFAGAAMVFMVAAAVIAWRLVL